MEQFELRRALAERGLVVPPVGRSRRYPDVLVVFLPGPESRWADGNGLELIRTVPGVVRAEPSLTFASVVLVRVRSETEKTETVGRSDPGPDPPR